MTSEKIDLERHSLLVRSGATLLSQGKVRDTYTLPDHTGHLLQVTTDRASIFDFILGSQFPRKGEVLNMMNVFWLTKVLQGVCPNHLVAAGTKIFDFLGPEARNIMDLHRRAIVVRDLSGEMLDIECIARGYLTGSGWKDYQRTATVCGHELPLNLHDGSRLPIPIFTPSTKAEKGHDLNIDFLSVREKYGEWAELLTLELYGRGAEYALTKGIIIADTKFEFGRQGILADEVLTPDSSRFWLIQDWEDAAEEGMSPQGFDKQFVREWGKTVETPFFDDEGVVIIGINNLKPEYPAHVRFVRDLPVPEKIISRTMQLYHQGFSALTGHTLDAFVEELVS